MFKNLLSTAVLATVVAATAVPAAAATPVFSVTIGSFFAVPGNNDFQGDLAALGLTGFATINTTLSITGPGRITFEYLGSESGFQDTFTAGPVTGTEIDGSATFASPIMLGSAIFAAGPFAPQFASDGNALIATPGSDGFGIFLPANTSRTYTSNVIYFGFDDQINNIDDNHDDFIVRATITAVPEPATWGLMIVGFGMVGLGLRRRGLTHVSA